jgi:activator of HSP90 ATPase
MNKVIEQTIDFQNASSKVLFEIFTDPKKHSIILGGAKVKISAKEGAEFTLFNGNVTGKNLRIVPNQMIVQSWRGNVWKTNDLDSILTIVFKDITSGCRLYMVHACTPVQFDEQWEGLYWKPIKNFLAKTSK